MKISNLTNKYPSKRNVVYAKNGMVATSQPLAAQAGIDIMKKGGNAVDAAIATAAALTVVEPTANGIGSDCFSIVWMNETMYGLNGSGYAPSSISIETLKEMGYDKIPTHGLVPVTVPGTPKAWAKMIERFGNLSLLEVLEPAIRYAREGFAISEHLAYGWNRAYEFYKKQNTAPEFSEWFKVFAPNNQPPKGGEIWKSENHAKTLEEIGKTNSDSFYSGELANKIDQFSKKYKGFISKEDLVNYDVEWVDPIQVNYKGYDIWEIPPNGQGIVALMGLNIMKHYDLPVKEDVDTYHLQIEAIKASFADAHKYVTDLKKMTVKVSDLLSETYAKNRAKLITENASVFEAGMPSKSGTVYLCTADKDGNMVSFIQSNYMGFGSGLVVEETGIALQNRGHNFSFDPEHDNHLAPNKKPYHTIIPGFITKDNEAVGPFGVMGGFMQPQGHLQVVMNMIDYGLNPQEALDAPRFRFEKEKEVHLEPHFDKEIAKQLAMKGHNIIYDVFPGGFGRGQIILKEKDSYIGGTESRTDGYIAVY